MKTGHIHAPSRVTPRLDRFLCLLRERGPRGATTAEIVSGAQVMAVSAIASEARAMGYRVECESAGISDAGGRIYRYWLTGEPT